MLRACRPRQWTKNLLVLTAPVAAGVITQPKAALGATGAIIAFCIASSGVYVVNDIRDVDSDRAHPSKRRRPVASGELPVPTAWLLAVVLLGLALGVAALQSPQLLAVLAAYEAIQLAYCLGMKNEPVIELTSVASGFLLRAIAGGVASDVVLSQWFLTAAGFGSLFIAGGKRYAELLLVERTGAKIRPVLARYTASYLRFVWTLSAAVLVTTYALWAFSMGQTQNNNWSIVSVVPFVIALFRYAVDVDSGQAGEPEEIVVHDRMLLLLAAIWTATLVASVYR